MGKRSAATPYPLIFILPVVLARKLRLLWAFNLTNQKTYNNPMEQKTMRKWRCKKCKYVYDPAVGDPKHGIPADTPFEQLPPNWKCPLCGAPKGDFEPL